MTGYDTSPLGVLLDPMYFVGGYAIHGNPSVPPYPASHGCVRVPNFVIYRLFGSEPYGETVYVYSSARGNPWFPREPPPCERPSLCPSKRSRPRS